MTQKFKVGDKVRILDASKIKGAKIVGLYDGAVTTVANLDSYGDPRLDSLNGHAPLTLFKSELRYIELLNAKPTQDKPTKKQRLSELERQVAELQAEVASLKESQKPTYSLVELLSQIPNQTPNEQRKAIIAEAKAFVEDVTSRNHPDLVSQGLTIGAWFVSIGAAEQTIKAEFIVNADKRTVVALIRDIRDKRKNEVRAKAIAKCAPDDVFNADIGKAIALGRALGLDVERFEQAVKPTEFAVGQVVDVAFVGGDKSYLVGEVTKVKSQSQLFFEKNGENDYCGVGYFNLENAVGVPKGSRILDDTNAEY